MRKVGFSLFVIVLLSGALAFSQTPQWSKEARKLSNCLGTLDTLLSLHPFPADVPGIETALTNKTQQAESDLAALDAALQAELGSLSTEERQEALATLAELLVQMADVGNMLAVRGFNALTLELVISYNATRASYYSLTQQFSLVTKRLPIGTQVQDGGSWIPW